MKVVGILLAAGFSTRFGTNKLLAALPADGPEAGTPVAVAAARHLAEALPESVAVVRPRAQKVSKNDSNRGGWRYSPDSGDSDMSVTVWQTMALRAAKNAGLDVPKQAIDDAVAYIRRLYQPDSEKRGAVKLGGFGYQTKGREMSTTAEGLLSCKIEGDPPPLKWSDLKYVLWHQGGSEHAKEETHA